MIDLEPCQLAVAWRRRDRRAVVRELVGVATEVAAFREAQAVPAR